MGNSVSIQYVFVILQPSASNKESIKSIMQKGVINTVDGIITFYASFKELYNAYSRKFSNREIWGIGIPLRLLDLCEAWKKAEKKVKLIDGELMCWKVETDRIDFSKPEIKKNVFFVAPSRHECEKVWLVDKTEEGYRLWWCKGIHKEIFYRWNDEEIKIYLCERKKPYYRKNYREVEEDKLFPNTNLMNGEEKNRYEYTLLALTPNEMHESEEEEKNVEHVNDIFDDNDRLVR